VWENQHRYIHGYVPKNEYLSTVLDSASNKFNCKFSYGRRADVVLALDTSPLFGDLILSPKRSVLKSRPQDLRRGGHIYLFLGGHLALDPPGPLAPLAPLQGSVGRQPAILAGRWRKSGRGQLVIESTVNLDNLLEDLPLTGVPELTSQEIDRGTGPPSEIHLRRTLALEIAYELVLQMSCAQGERARSIALDKTRKAYVISRKRELLAPYHAAIDEYSSAKDDYASLSREAEYAVERMVAARRLAFSLEKTQVELRKQPEEEFRDLEKLLEGAVKDITVDMDRYIQVRTNNIVIDWDGKGHRMGAYHIRIRFGVFDGDSIRMTPLDWDVLRYKDPEGNAHPHVSADFKPCWGNLAIPLGEALSERNMFRVVEICLQLLNSYNIRDPYANIGHWHEDGPEEDDQFFGRNFEECYDSADPHMDCRHCESEECQYHYDRYDRCYESIASELGSLPQTGEQVRILEGCVRCDACGFGEKAEHRLSLIRKEQQQQEEKCRTDNQPTLIGPVIAPTGSSQDANA
jgi:hypothetical protein